MFINVKLNHVIRLKQNLIPLFSYPWYPYMHGYHGYGYGYGTRTPTRVPVKKKANVWK